MDDPKHISSGRPLSSTSILFEGNKMELVYESFREHEEDKEEEKGKNITLKLLTCLLYIFLGHNIVRKIYIYL